MDWFNLAVAIAFLLIIMIANVYFLAYNAHPNDTKFGSNIISRIIVVLAFTISYMPIMLVPLDVTNSQSAGGLDMDTIWTVLFIVQVVCVWVLFPILIVYYEGNENDLFKKKLKRAMQVAIPMFTFFVLLTVPTYYWLSDYSIPKEDIDNLGFSAPIGSVLVNGHYVGNVNFVVYLIGMMSFIGSLMFSFFGGVGFVSLPYDTIYEYVSMPQPIQEKDFTRRKQMLLNYTLKLREMGKSLENERTHVAQIKGFSGWKKRRAFSKKVRIYEARSLLAEKEFNILDLEANYYQKVEPLKYTFRLILGIIYALLSLNWLAQIDVTILGSIIFVIMAYYLLLVSLKGNMTYGYRTACFTFYPITPNETQFNSFLFNASLLNLLTTSIIRFTCVQIPSFVKNAYIYKILTITTYTQLFSLITKYRIFQFLILTVSLTTLVTLLIRGGRRLKFSEIEKVMGKKKSSKSKSKGKKQQLVNEEDDDDDEDEEEDEEQ